MDRKSLEQIAYEAVNLYYESEFPARHFGLYLGNEKHDSGEILIRIPGTIPTFMKKDFLRLYDENYTLKSKTDERDFYRAHPCIERISLPLSWQRKGFFSNLIRYLSNLEEVKYIIVSNVTNPTFENYLKSTDSWQQCQFEWRAAFPSFYINANSEKPQS